MQCMRHPVPDEEEEAPSPRPSAAGCYAFLRRGGHGTSNSGYRRLESSGVVRVEVGKARSVYHVDAAVLEAEPVRRLLAAAGRRGRDGGAVVAVAVDALLFEHLLWLAAADADAAAADVAADLSEIVAFYSQDDDAEDHEDHQGALKR